MMRVMKFIKPGENADQKAWLDMLDRRPEFQRPPPRVAVNPFTKETMTFQVPEGAAEVILDQRVIGTVAWSEKDRLVSVSIEPAGLALAQEWADELHGTLVERSEAGESELHSEEDGDEDLSYDDLTVTPFDLDKGIFFKYGRIYQDRARQIDAFEKATGFELPSDFLDLIEDYCEGGFDGEYIVHEEDGLKVLWHHLLLMKLPDEHDQPDYDALRLIRANPTLFGEPGNLRAFPFGQAEHRGHIQSSDGYLAFDVARESRVIFVSSRGHERFDIANSFRDMMLKSSFVFYG